jgi:FkbM family methyltransferase
VFDKQRRRDKIIGKMFPDQDVLNQIYAYNIPIHEIEDRHDVKTLLLNKLGITLNTPAQLEFLRTYPWAIRLLHDGIFMFKQDKNRRIFLEGNGITIQIPHSNYVYIAYEIFLNKIYNLKITKPSVVFDIGMNAGIASLFFANEKFVHKVIGYEPFEQTYNLALENFRINPGLKGKIEAHNFGLGDNEMQLELPYTPNASEHSGEKGIPDHILETRQLTVVIEKIQIKKASEVLCKEIENWKHHDIFLKMDCEGCENSVLADLYENKVLERFHAILMEWHDEGSEYPEKILHQSGFKVISLPDNLGGNSTGMLYAIKTNP